MAKQVQDASPLVVFFVYVAAAFAGICGYRFFYPLASPGAEILACFKMPYGFTGGIILFIELFPALAFSGLVIPFGLKEHSEGGYAGTAFVGKKGFSAVFLKYLSWPVITAAFAAVCYSLLFFLVLPVTNNFCYSMQDRSELFARAKLRAEEKAADKNWAEASQFIEICEGIWPDNEEIAELKIRLVDSLSSYRRSLETSREMPFEDEPVWAGIPGNPVNAADALKLAENAFNQEQYYDAHWLATLAQRLANPGSAEIGDAVLLAGRAWEKIAALEPNALEKERYSLYRMKRDAYEAMNAGNWITAFYTFQELSVLTPKDPDVIKYLETSKVGVARSAFFFDELDLAMGAALNGPVFSMPFIDGGRLVLYFSSLALLQDNAYAWGTEIIASDSEGRLRFQLASDYAKFIPVSGIDNEGNPDNRTALLFRALDRTDKTKSSGPVWLQEGLSPDPVIGSNQILLPISYDNFLLLSRVKQGAEILNLRELFTAEKILDSYGYIRESFRAEIFRRLGNALFFLPMSILTLVLGWRYRARKKPRYVYVPMLALLPLVFWGAVLFYRNIIANLSIWLSLTMGLSAALVYLGLGAFALFILALVVLAAQHG